MRWICGIGAAMTVLAAGALAQSFDAAVIRESPIDGTGGGMRLQRNGDIRVEHMRARFLITIAHQIEPYQLIGAPAWTDATYYDITAKANASVTRAETFAMMRSLLADRFHLTFHRESRSVPGFALVRASRSLGAGLKPSAVNCDDNPRGPRCAEGAMTPTTMTAFGLPLDNLIRLLAGQIVAPIVNETNLSGPFDVQLKWSAEGAITDDAPVITTAIQEQLGLKLERRQVPVEAFVIDRVERPSPD